MMTADEILRRVADDIATLGDYRISRETWIAVTTYLVVQGVMQEVDRLKRETNEYPTLEKFLAACVKALAEMECKS